MRWFLLVAAASTAALAAAMPTAAAPVSQSSWATQANQVCSVWIAKAKKEFGSPVTPAQLYSFAHKAKTLEMQELAALEQIPGRTAAGTAALAAVRVDIAEIGSAISAWDHGKPASFVTILKRYLNDGRPKSAFAVAGASQCG
ncbi:MAG TPA: hypothetical protein VN770_07795 [Gaiellaceae bacterium]|nr:hypothetical protein [Gaiellaceae bacterium]